MRIWIFLGCLMSMSAIADAEHIQFHSGGQRVHVLELYTSEGCSSCPPAEDWLSTLQDHPGLWSRVVPVVFHVDYWNDLGWIDPFSSPQNSQRQRQYRRQGGIMSVYTPGFVLSGQEWRSWFWNRNLKLPVEPAGNLSVSVNGQRVTARFNPVDATGQWYELHLALLGFDLTTQVPAGENKGRALTHQFVVLEQTKQLASSGRWSVDWPVIHKPGKTALAAWVTYPDQLQPLQATGGWLSE